MKTLMALWVVMLIGASTPVEAASRQRTGGGRGDNKVETPSPNPRGNAYGHQNERNPHYVAPVVEEPQASFTVCPTLTSAPHMCGNYVTQ